MSHYAVGFQMENIDSNRNKVDRAIPRRKAIRHGSSQSIDDSVFVSCFQEEGCDFVLRCLSDFTGLFLADMLRFRRRLSQKA